MYGYKFFLSFFFITNFLLAAETSGHQFFKEVKSPFVLQEVVVQNAQALLSVCKDALLVCENKRNSSVVTSIFTAPVDTPIFKAHGIKAADVEHTLKFVIKVIEKDLAKKRPLRIYDPQFLMENFNLIQWSGDTVTAKKNGVVIPQWPEKGIFAQDRIRLTNYAAFKVLGSDKKTNHYCCALYELLGGHHKEAQTKTLFTKQQVLQGAFDDVRYKKLVKPLVWLTRDGLEDALMQGSIVVQMPHGKKRIFNVYKNNEIVFDKSIKDNKQQGRYWFFKEISNMHGSETEVHLRALTQEGALVAGNVMQLGKGKVIALQYQNPVTRKNEIRLVVLNDMGSAFDHLYGLDLFMGVFEGKAAFKKKSAELPNTVKAYILIKKKADK